MKEIFVISISIQSQTSDLTEQKAIQRLKWFMENTFREKKVCSKDTFVELYTWMETLGTLWQKILIFCWCFFLLFFLVCR